MLCAEFCLKVNHDDGESVLPLPCRCWSCDYCQPRRRMQLIAMAAAGEPNKLLTLTINAAIGETPTERYRLLHNAWKLLVKRIKYNLALPALDRWRLKLKRRSAKQQAIIDSVTAQTAPCKTPVVEYMAFCERTKRGEPHLHILLRSAFIPQDWISEQMLALARSPIVWIEKINGTRQAIKYVTKYVTKEPAQFGTSKRYWKSKNYETQKGDDPPECRFAREQIEVVRSSFRDMLQERITTRWTWIAEPDGWFRFYRPGVNQDRAGWIKSNE